MSQLMLPDLLVSVEWLKHNLSDPRLVVFDASWHMPMTQRDGAKEWAEAHIPGSVHFDFDRHVCAPDTELPHMVPDEALFGEKVRELGLSQDSVVVIYDSDGIFTAPRVWWMLKSMGCEHCAILNGGLAAWEDAGYETWTAEQASAPVPGDFVACYDTGWFVAVDDVKAALADDSQRVIDARPGPRYLGEVDEPRPGLRRGHMPGARNLPFPDLFRQGQILPDEEMKSFIGSFTGDAERCIFSCGSGVTACIPAFFAYRLGYRNLAVYDASWSEWGLPGDLPVETG